jgi:hypothetical protein
MFFQPVYCKVKGCRYALNHITAIHICGNCKKKGHGQLECGYNDEIIKLSNKMSEIPPHLYCTIKKCKNKKTHTTTGHKCTLCFKFGHCRDDCNETFEIDFITMRKLL